MKSVTQLVRQRRAVRFTRVFIILTLVLMLVYQLGPPRQYSSPKLSVASDLQYSPHAKQAFLPPALKISLPFEYTITPAHGPMCLEKFSSQYLNEFTERAISYCSQQSTADITCFHSRKQQDGRTHSLCYGRGVAFDASKSKFSLECSMRQLTQEEKDRGLIPFHEIQSYWYDTGPPRIFAKAVDIREPQSLTGRAQELNIDLKAGGLKSFEGQDAPPRNFLLLKREGEGNLWHFMLEIFSAWMSFDVLRMSQNPANNGEPFFHSDEAVDTQVIILDNCSDGPYFDLWTLFARRKPLRLGELASQPKLTEAIHKANIIVPLAGNGNPLWKDDWEFDQCSLMPTISVFSRRVLGFYNVLDPTPRSANDPIAVTFIDRMSSRRLLNKDAILAEVKKRVPHITLQVVDFAAIPFPEQLRIIRATDVLIGVHGAGLTHALFMRENAGVVVEIQPPGMDFHPMRNVALLNGLSYFRVHADAIIENDTWPKSNDWHQKDIRIEVERFVQVVDTAVRSLFSNGMWDFDADQY
jgi:protein O-GlcNAc transferase